MVVLVGAEVAQEPIEGGEMLEGLSVVSGKAAVEGAGDLASRDGRGTKAGGRRQLSDFGDLIKDGLEFRSERRRLRGGIA